MAWAALVGSGIQFEANSREDMRKRELAQRQGAAQSQVDNWGRQSDQLTLDQLRALRMQRFAANQKLAEGLGSGNRLAAGDAARTQANTRMQSALGANAPATAITQPVTDSPALSGWGANAAATYAPAMQARMKLIADQRAQGGMGNYDTGLLNSNADTNIDISRQSDEWQQRQQYLAAVRARMLAEAGVKNSDLGPGNGYNNAQLLAGLISAGGQAYGAYGQSQPRGYSYANTNEIGASRNAG